MKNGISPLVLIILAGICIFAITVFMVGGIIQDVDYHDLTALPLLEQQAAYDKMQTRRSVGEAMQLAGFIVAFAGFVTVAVYSLAVGHSNAKEAEKKYTDVQ